MLKKISIKDVKAGMYLHELCGSWLEHPFWRSAFVLTDTEDLRRLTGSGIKELWIDTSKGLDIAFGQAKHASDAAVEQVLTVVAAQARKATSERTPIEDEMARAGKIIARSKAAVASMFTEARMGKALDADEALPLVEEISASVSRNPGAIISLARLKNKDDYTYMHSVAVCALMVSLARQMALSEADTRDAGMAGLLHDVGKMIIPDKVLNKTDKLTDEEFIQVKSHPEEGYKLLQAGKNINVMTLDVCLHHHEKVDGSGYPYRLKDEDISLYAKMGAVCDVYDAITSNRPYKAGWDPGESLRKMTEWCNGHFDQRIFHAFVKSVGIYPVGSLIRLHSGRLAIVIDQTNKSLLAPKVRVFFSTKSNSHVTPETLDLSSAAARDKIFSLEDPAKWKFTDLDKMWRNC